MTLALAAPAAAQPRGWRGAAGLEIDAAGATVTEAGAAEEREHQGSFGVLLRALVGPSPLCYGLGFDYRLGASYPGGFLYAFHLYPAGLGVVLSDVFKLALYAGAGVSGVSARVPAAAVLPLESRLDLRLGRRLWITAAARVSWTSGEARDAGSSTAGFADELFAQLEVRWSKRYLENMSRMSGGDGYYLAATLEESLGSRVVGAAFGYSLDFTGSN